MARNQLELPGHAGRPPFKAFQIVLPLLDGSLDYEEFIQHLGSERLENTGRNGRNGDERTWKRSGPNHWFDCSIYAFACALDLDPYQEQLTFDEAQAIEEAPPKRPPAPEDRKPGWIRDAGGGKDWIATRD
jgi:phage terminase large subunit GpA-like protein